MNATFRSCTVLQPINASFPVPRLKAALAAEVLDEIRTKCPTSDSSERDDRHDAGVSVPSTTAVGWKADCGTPVVHLCVDQHLLVHL